MSLDCRLPTADWRLMTVVPLPSRPAERRQDVIDAETAARFEGHWGNRAGTIAGLLQEPAKREHGDAGYPARVGTKDSGVGRELP